MIKDKHTQEHKNSRFITIYRAGSFLSRAQGPQIDDYFSTSKRSIGSFWDDTRKVGKGLSVTEIELIVAPFLDALPGERDYHKQVENFFNDLSTDVPHQTGRTLQIGLTIDNEGFLSQENRPLDPMDYIRYRHALANPKVAATKEIADSDQIIEFYIFDKNAAASKAKATNKLKDDAMKVYLDLKDVAMKVEQIMVLMGEDIRRYAGETKEAEMQTDLRKLSAKKPQDFIDKVNSPMLEAEYLLTKLVLYKIVNGLAGRYIDAETKQLIGNSKDEVVCWLNDPENSDVVLAYKDRLQEKRK